MNPKFAIDAFLIAPCGMNCWICKFHLRQRKPCPGCNGGDRYKSAHCITCPIKQCDEHIGKPTNLCIECAEFPCARVLHLDKRYRTKYHMSMIANLQTIQSFGMDAFIRQEQTRWACPRCDGIISCHTGACVVCGEKGAYNETGYYKRTL